MKDFPVWPTMKQKTKVKFKQCTRCDGMGVVEKSDEELEREESPVLTKQCSRCKGMGTVRK